MNAQAVNNTENFYNGTSGNRVSVYELSGMLDGIRIRCVRRDSRNALWLRTYGKGLLRVLPSGLASVTYTNQYGVFTVLSG